MKEVIVRATKMALEVGSAFFNTEGSVKDYVPNLVSLSAEEEYIPNNALVSGMVEDYINQNSKLISLISNIYVGIILKETSTDVWEWEVKLYVKSLDKKF